MDVSHVYPQKSSATASRILGGEAVVVLPRQSLVNTLNSVGTRIWELADGAHSVSEIVDAITNEFQVEKTIAEQDAIEFLRDLEKRGMLTLVQETVDS